MRASGTSRTFLLVALGVAVGLVVLGGWYLTETGPDAPGGASEEDDPDGEGAEDDIDDGDLPPGVGNPKGARRAKAPGEGQEPGDEDDLSDLPDDKGEPWGPSFHITPETMKNLLQANDWEEFRRQLHAYQDEGKSIPPDLVAALLELLKVEGRRIDAMLALGLVKDDATGALLAQTAADDALPSEVRVAALQALAKSGQAAALPEVRRLVESSQGDSPLMRNALAALGAIGGPEGVKPLLAQLAAHKDDDLTGSVLTALAKSRGGDDVLAQSLREARTAGDGENVALLLRVGTQMGAASGPQLRREVQTLVSNPTSLAGMAEDQEGRDRLRMTAIFVASAMGGDALGAVVDLARNETGNVKSAALASLRNARGDDSARRILTLLTPGADSTTRYEATVALGATGSREATSTVHALLDDADGAVREAASSAVAQIRDPDSIPVALDRLGRIESSRERAAADTTVARNLIKALGQIGAKAALPKLKALLESPEQFWKDQEMFLRQAIRQIDSGDPDATRIR